MICWVNLTKRKIIPFSLSSYHKTFYISDVSISTGPIKLQGQIWKSSHWLICLNYYADIAPLSTWNNINRLSQVPTHRVSDHCQHANQGQGADGERQSRKTICRWKDREVIRDLTLASERNINELHMCKLSRVHFLVCTLMAFQSAEMFPAFKPYCSNCMKWTFFEYSEDASKMSLPHSCR